MTVCVIGVLFVASCTSDEFFGIEADHEGVDYSTLNNIALSKEYVEYQKQLFLSLNAMNSIDTTKKVIVDYYEGRTIYAYEEIVSFRPLFDAYKELIESYPEYEKTNNKEKHQILNLAIYNNRSLRKMSEKYQFVTSRTKSCSPESMAYLYAQASNAVQINSCKWSVENVAYWYADDFYPIIVSAALNMSYESGNECGGMVFFDDSGILNEDLNATPESMTLYYDERIPFQPIYDFHVHPDDDLNCSDEDVLLWALEPWSVHYIVTKSGCERYEVQWPN